MEVGVAEVEDLRFRPPAGLGIAVVEGDEEEEERMVSIEREEEDAREMVVAMGFADFEEEAAAKFMKRFLNGCEEDRFHTFNASITLSFSFWSLATHLLSV